MDEYIINKKTGLPEIPGERLQEFTDHFEHVIDGAMISKHIVFIQTRRFEVEADRAIDDDYDDSEVFWSIRRPRIFGESYEHLIVRSIPDEFTDFHDDSLEEILKNEKACEIIRRSLDPITLHEMMSVTEVLDSAFLKKLGIIRDADIGHDTSLDINISQDF